MGPGYELLGEEERSEVLDTLQGFQLSRYRFDGDGPPSKVFKFEREMEQLLEARRCIGMNSCTSALLAGMLASGVGPGMEVIVPGYTFIASVAAVAYTGATPVLAEVDESLTLAPADVESRITPATRAVLAVHMLGAPCDMDSLTKLCDRHGLLLFEDCAQAGGGSYKDRHLGTFGHFGAFSLNVFKTFTAGEGGLFCTDDEATFRRAYAIHDHGWQPFRLGVVEHDGLLGLNLKMHELSGAIALAQARKLPEILRRMRQHRDVLVEAIGELPGARIRTLHDPNGDCGTVLAYIFDEPSLATAVAARLGTRTLAQSGKHNYANMGQLAARAMPTASCPFSCPAHPTRPRYAPGSLARTDDLLARTVAIGVGVLDSYLGTSFGTGVRATPEELAAAAATFRDAVGSAQDAS
jgi:dTDP-4-amino-4,6-dideoxygalactose transaminase